MALTKREQAQFERLKAKAGLPDPIKLNREMVKRIGAHLALHRTTILTVGKKGHRVCVFTRATHATRVRHGKKLGAKKAATSGAA